MLRAGRWTRPPSRIRESAGLRPRRLELCRKPDARAANGRESDAAVEALLHVDDTCVDGANGSCGDDDDVCGDNDSSDVWRWAAGFAAAEIYVEMCECLTRL
jgi:hypothetical protein